MRKKRSPLRTMIAKDYLKIARVGDKITLYEDDKIIEGMVGEKGRKGDDYFPCVYLWNNTHGGARGKKLPVGYTYSWHIGKEAGNLNYKIKLIGTPKTAKEIGTVEEEIEKLCESLK